jgi:tRNA (guanine-N7-)-methyltransferase
LTAGPELRDYRGVPGVDDIVVSPPESGQVLDWAVVFGNDASVEMEIGCGKGGFLLRQARAHPERNYFGIEWANKYYRFAADRMVRWGVRNVRLMRTDARQLMLGHVPPASLSALHIYHPDPWPKKRHHKRRLFQSDFVEAAVRALRPGARWAIQTDHAGYFEVVQSLTSQRPELEVTAYDDPDFGAAGDRTETNFEIKYLREGRAIYRLAYRKIG